LRLPEDARCEPDGARPVGCEVLVGIFEALRRRRRADLLPACLAGARSAVGRRALEEQRRCRAGFVVHAERVVGRPERIPELAERHVGALVPFVDHPVLGVRRAVLQLERGGAARDRRLAGGRRRVGASAALDALLTEAAGAHGPAGADTAGARFAGAARIAVVAARPVRLDAVGGTRGRRARARLGDVARARRHPAHDAARPERVGRTRIARPVATLGDVARAGRGPTDGGALRVRRTGDARPVASLGEITGARRRTADGPGGEDAIARARARVTGAGLRGVAGA